MTKKELSELPSLVRQYVENLEQIVKKLPRDTNGKTIAPGDTIMWSDEEGEKSDYCELLYWDGLQWSSDFRKCEKYEQKNIASNGSK